MKTKSLLALLALGVAVVLSGCSSSGDALKNPHNPLEFRVTGITAGVADHATARTITGTLINTTNAGINIATLSGVLTMTAGSGGTPTEGSTPATGTNFVLGTHGLASGILPAGGRLDGVTFLITNGSGTGAVVGNVAVLNNLFAITGTAAVNAITATMLNTINDRARWAISTSAAT